MLFADFAEGLIWMCKTVLRAGRLLSVPFICSSRDTGMVFCEDV